MGNWQLRANGTLTKGLALALLAGVAGCSDDFARFNGPLTTASLGIEPSNQDRIIRKAGSGGSVATPSGSQTAAPARPGVTPVGAPEQEFPTASVESTYIAPAVEVGSLPPLEPSEPAADVAEIVSEEPIAKVEKTVRVAKVVAPVKTVRRITKPRLAAAGIPVVPPAPEAPGRLRRIGESLTTGSVKPARPASRRPAPVAAGGVHTVVSGDTVYALARRHGVTSAALLAANGLDSAALSIGQKLVIPGSSTPTPAATRAVKAEPAPSVTVAPKKEAVVAALAVERPEPVRKAEPVKTAKVSSDDRSFAWPARGRIVKTFGQRTPKGANDGIDIALPMDTPVGAAADGIVLYAGSELADFGNLVLVRHDDGWVSAYANASKNLVKRGDRVTKGQPVVRSGKSGNATVPQLHFELRRNSKPVDPERYLKG